MRSLTVNTIRNKSKRYGNEPINLLEIEFGGVVGTKYYSDRTIIVDGNTYEPLVKEWGRIDSIVTNSATVQDVRVILVNSTSSPISDIFDVVAPESKVAKIYQWFVDDNMEVGDKTLLFNGRIASPVKYSIDNVEFDIVNRINDLETKLGRVVTASEFPRSLPSHRGRIIPRVIGTVDNVPAVCIYTAGKSELRESLNATSLSIAVDDGSVFPTNASWVMILEEEQILMASNPTGGNTLTATQRGYNGTTAVLHTKGTQLYEQLSQFRYCVFDAINNVKAASISNVRVNGVLLDDSEYTIDQDNYPGQIIFDSYPEVNSENETVFDNYDFDVVVNDESTPYAEEAIALIDDNNSNYAWLLSGQRVELQRNIALNNINQFKRAWLEVTYFTDNRAWDGQIEARVYWNGNNLGLLNDPTFDIKLEEELRVINNPGDIVINPFDPIDPARYANNDMSKEEVLTSEAYTETEVVPSSLSIETHEINHAVYSVVVDQELTHVPAAYFTASTEGMTGKVALFQHYCVGAFPATWEADVNNFKWIDWVYSGFSFSPPTQGGTARITSVTPVFTSNFKPSGAYSVVTAYRVRKQGESTYQTISVVPGILALNPLYIHEISDFQVVIRTYTYVRSRPPSSVEERQPLIAELNGSLNNVSITVEYELTKEPAEDPGEPEEEDPELVVPQPVDKSHEVTMTFEITDYVDDFVNLLNTSAQISFESDGAYPGTNLFIKDVHIITESGKYNFEYTDEITADVSGYYVGGGVITTDYGPDGELINRPDNVFKFLLTWNSIFSISADLDTSYYDAVVEFYQQQLYRLDFAIVEPITLRNLLEKIAFQTRTDQYWEDGVHKIKVLEVENSTLKQLTTSDIAELSIERSDSDQLINLLEVRYNIDYSFLVDYTPNKFSGIITVENTTSQSTYGVRESKDETFFFDLVRDAVTANHVSNYYLSFYSVIRKYLTVRCFLNQLEFQKHDILGITFPLGLTNTPGRVLSNNLIMGGNNQLDYIEFGILLEDYTYHKLSVTDSMTLADVIQLTLVHVVTIADSFTLSDVLSLEATKSISDSVGMSDLFLYTMSWDLIINESTEGGWGFQPWGVSSWGGSGISFFVSEELYTSLSIGDLSNRLDMSSAFSILDNLLITISHYPYIAENDELYSVTFFSDSITVNKL